MQFPSTLRMEPVPIWPLPGPIPFANEYPRRNAQQYSKSEWESKKSIIKRLYINLEAPLKRVMKIMTEEHDFHATRKMYVDHLKTWEFKKNCTKKNIPNLLHQKSEVAATTRASKLEEGGKLIGVERPENHAKRTSHRAELPPAKQDEQAKRADGEEIRQASIPTNLDFQDMPSDPIWPQLLPSGKPFARGDYELDCPYRLPVKKFRLIESFQNGAIYEADSLGFRSYIAADEERPCTEDCYCRRHTLLNDFSFQVHKSIDKMDITIFSDDLYHNLLGYGLEDLQEGVENQETVVNGLNLLKNYHYLKSQTNALHSGVSHHPSTNSLLLEMELLVDGLLADGEVFKSFGYEELYERKVLDFKIWKKFQQDKFERDVSALEEGFDEIDDEYDDLPTPPQQPNSSKVHGLDDNLEGVPTYLWCSSSSNEQSIPAGSTADAAIDFDCDARSAPATDLSTVEYATPTIEDCESFRELATSYFSLADAAEAGNQEAVQLLLDQGVEINGSYHGLQSPLATAAKAGHEAIVQLLLDRGASLARGAWDKNNCPLTLAAEAGHKAVVRLLLDRGLYATDSVKIVLIEAAKAGHKEMVQLLLNHDAYDFYLRKTILIEAAKAGHKEVVQSLLGRRFYGSRSGETILIEAAKAGHKEVVQLLLDQRFHGSRSRETTLIEAAKAGHKEVVQLLLGRRFYGSRSRETILIEAAKAGHKEVAQLLLNRDVYAPRSKATALIEAAKAGHEVVVGLLLERGADVNNDKGYYSQGTPLAMAADAGHEAVVRLLLERGTDINGYEQFIDDAMVASVIRGQMTEMRRLIKEGADVNATTRFGTALGAAARVGNGSTLRWLLRQGAEVHTTAQILQNSDDTKDKVALIRLASWVRNFKSLSTEGQSDSHSKRAERFRCLHKKFIFQHALMTSASQSSCTDFLEVSQTFKVHRDTWQAGVKTLRGLKLGEQPTIANTIAYLCLVKAISETLQSTSVHDYTEPFFQDLIRWELIFTEERDRDAYRDAICSMWGVWLDGRISSKEQVDSQVTGRFFSLASILISQTSEQFGWDSLNEQSLQRSQQAWKVRNGYIPPVDDVVPLAPDLTPNPLAIDPPDQEIYPNPGFLQQNISDGSETVAIPNPKVVFIMLGAAFAITIIFLQSDFVSCSKG